MHVGYLYGTCSADMAPECGPLWLTNVSHVAVSDWSVADHWSSTVGRLIELVTTSVYVCSPALRLVSQQFDLWLTVKLTK